MVDVDALLLRRRFAAVIALLACASVLLLAWLGFVAIRQWQRSVELLANRQSEEASDLLLSAALRDMQAVQRSVLLSPGADTFALESSYDAVNTVASAFARYRYPESFFLWRRDEGAAAPQFFSRRERLPPWSEPAIGPNRFPVVLERHPEVGRMLLARIEEDVALGRRFSVFETTVSGTPYQVVARLFFADRFRQELAGVLGFTVNLAWVRQHYFEPIVLAAATGAARSDVLLAVLDDQGKLVAGARQGGVTDVTLTASRPFSLYFFNPLLIASKPATDIGRRQWVVLARPKPDGSLALAIRAAGRLHVLQALAALTLALGLVLTIRAARTSLRLSELRSDFISSVTHEFKTPIATIRASGQTLASERLVDEATRRRFARVIVHETRRLARLVDNLLAFSRITDKSMVATHYEAVAVRDLVDGTLQRFHLLLADGQFDVVIDVPEDVSHVWGDASALALVFDNLVDNAIRHSKTAHRLRILARPDGGAVVVEVEDRGGGIDADEMPHVTRKFYRGRNAGHGGTGLGLAIASRIIAEHQGELSLLNTPGGGTTVRLTIPKAPATAPPHAVSSPATLA